MEVKAGVKNAKATSMVNKPAKERNKFASLIVKKMTPIPAKVTNIRVNQPNIFLVLDSILERISPLSGAVLIASQAGTRAASPAASSPMDRPLRRVHKDMFTSRTFTTK